MQLPYDPAIAILGMYLREMKTYVYIKPVQGTWVAQSVKCLTLFLFFNVYLFSERERESTSWGGAERETEDLKQPLR